MIRFAFAIFLFTKNRWYLLKHLISYHQTLCKNISIGFNSEVIIKTAEMNASNYNITS